MKRLAGLALVLASCLLLLSGCGGDSKDSETLTQLKEDNAPYDPSVPNVKPAGTLGDLVDLGDLLADLDPSEPGDHWYYTRAARINDSGIVVGQSNRGGPVRGAFSWSPDTGLMTSLGIHSGWFDDYYNIDFEREDPRKPLIYSEAVDVNQGGVVVGNSTTGMGWPDDSEKRAFVWQDDAFIDLPAPPYEIEKEGVICMVNGQYSEAVDINEAGEVVLTMDDKEGRHVYYWGGTFDLPVDLHCINNGVPTGPVSVSFPHVELLGKIVGEDSEAVAINEHGQAVINSSSTVIFHDLNWEVIETLNHLPGATRTEAVDINDSRYTNNDGIPDGHVIGNSGNDNLIIGEDDSVRGFFWDGGAMYPVDDLGGGTSVTTDINNQDQVVGGAMTEEGYVHAYIWTLDAKEKGLIRDLGTLGGANSFATAINEAGDVVGWSETGEMYDGQGVVAPIRHAFLWRKGVMYDLGTHNYFYNYPFVPSFPYSEAVDVNASGDVAGNSITINNHSRGFFLRPDFP